MKIPGFNKEKDLLEEEIKIVLKKMGECKNKESQEYLKLLGLLKELKNLSPKKDKVKPDTIVLIGANLVGLLIILNYEKANIITGKAYSWLRRV